MAKPALFARIAATPEIGGLAPVEAEVVRAARLWAISARLGRNPCDDLGRRLASVPAARHFTVLMALAVAAWPEPFRVHPPCCARVSYDEKLLSDMIARGSRGDRAGFHALLEEMLPGDMIERLFAAASWFAEAMAGRALP